MKHRGKDNPKIISEKNSFDISKFDDGDLTVKLENGKTLGQTLTDANNGSINDMSALGHYYMGIFLEFGTNSVDALAKSIYWFERAIRNGANKCWVYESYINNQLMDAELFKEIGLKERTVPIYESIIKYGNQALTKCVDLTSEDIVKLNEYINNAKAELEI